MSTSNAWKKPAAEELQKLRNAGMTLKDIGVHYGVSRALVKRWCADLGIFAARDYRKPPPSPPPHSKRRAVDEDEIIDPHAGLTVTEKAALILGVRMREDRRLGSYLLDGRPVKVEVLLAAAGLAIPNEQASVM